MGLPRDPTSEARHAGVAAPDGPVGAVDLHHDLDLFPVVFLGGGNQGRLDPLEDDLFVDIFIAVNCVDYSQDFIRIHRLSLSQGLIQAIHSNPSRPVQTAETLQNLTWAELSGY